MEINNKQRCRACLGICDSIYDLGEKYDRCTEKKVYNLWQLLEACASMQLQLNDSFPQVICKICLFRANDSYQFRLQCEKAQTQLRAERESNMISLEAQDAVNLGKLNMTFNKEKPVQAKQQSQFTCDRCGKKFKCQAGIIKHKLKQCTSRLCIYCDDSLANATLLARHMEQMHAHLKTVKCPDCGKTFFKTTNLRLHMNVHSGVKRHMCEVCGMSFALAGNLATHRRLHTGQKPYTCKECSRSFAQQAALRSHEAGHSDRKDHVCNQCGAAFSRAGALRNHSKRHLSVRPFACSLCDKAFTFSSERKRHMIVHTGEKNYECNMCGSRFNRSTNLAVHRRIHTGDTPYVCSICGKEFSRAHCLRSHISLHS